MNFVCQTIFNDSRRPIEISFHKGESIDTSSRKVFGNVAMLCIYKNWEGVKIIKLALTDVKQTEIELKNTKYFSIL